MERLKAAIRSIIGNNQQYEQFIEWVIKSMNITKRP